MLNVTLKKFFHLKMTPRAKMTPCAKMSSFKSLPPHVRHLHIILIVKLQAQTGDLQGLRN